MSTTSSSNLDFATPVTIGMNFSSTQDVLKQFETAGLSPPAAEWLLYKMVGLWNLEPSVEQLNHLDPDDWYGYIVEGTVEVGRFRPTLNEINDAAKNRRFDRLIEFGETVTAICKAGPDVQDRVSFICSNNSNPATRKLWDTFCKLPRDAYNDQFAIKCYINESRLERILKPKGLVDKLDNYFGNLIVWGNAGGLERELKGNGYKFKNIRSLRNCTVSQGDVIKVAKKNWHDRFTCFALVSETFNGEAALIEFKLPWNSPLRANPEGFDIFFLRDAETAIEGIWQRPTISVD